MIRAALTGNMTLCSDCGGGFDKSIMFWGRNSWNDKKITDAKFAYVCPTCWDLRGAAFITDHPNNQRKL